MNKPRSLPVERLPKALFGRPHEAAGGSSVLTWLDRPGDMGSMSPEERKEHDGLLHSLKSQNLILLPCKTCAQKHAPGCDIPCCGDAKNDFQREHVACPAAGRTDGFSGDTLALVGTFNRESDFDRFTPRAEANVPDQLAGTSELDAKHIRADPRVRRDAALRNQISQYGCRVRLIPIDLTR